MWSVEWAEAMETVLAHDVIALMKAPRRCPVLPSSETQPDCANYEPGYRIDQSHLGLLASGSGGIKVYDL